MAYTLIHRTGLTRGRVYNGSGLNITESPGGAGNDMVGPWAYDYSDFTNTGSGDLFDAEFSGIIADGRQLQSGQNEDDSILYPDLDDDEDQSDRGSVVGRSTQRAYVNRAFIRAYHTSASWDDAFVWAVPQDGSDPTQVSDLPTWMADNAGTEYPQSWSAWHPMRHALRVPFMWAIYRVHLGPNYESLADMIVANTTQIVGQGPQMAYGPIGMLAALHGPVYAAQHATRLYEPNIGIVPVNRGMFHLAYDAAHDDTNYDLTTGAWGQPRDPDIQARLDYEDPEQGLNYYLQPGTILNTPAQRQRGGIATTTMEAKKMRVGPDAVLIWHIQSCPVRIGYVRDPGTGTVTGHFVVGNTVSAYYGPYFRLVYHEATARFTAR